MSPTIPVICHVDDELAEANPGRALLDTWLDALPGVGENVTRPDPQPALNS
ncbi:hypothetical protein JTZ10_20105 [Gordonia rubripertincta]|uniref:Uncharacterized protein n=1 Tax=Gordonia rubripertincta TaxID=36822 RepID=A0AAW4GAB5_GORRU|nr:hypothetical protein [Gordonia rubripertincta]MBM7280055.1 hypothetical protein [Gordonia rubripertincta]